MKVKLISAMALAAAAFLTAVPAGASLLDHGLTYTLSLTGSCGVNCDTFKLEITGINVPVTDTEGGRQGVLAFGFTTPTGYLAGNATAPSGFTLKDGGLASGGCDGSGGFFCFSNNAGYAALMAGAILPANSTLDFLFSVTAPGIDTWAPHFKITWVGDKSKVNNGKFHSGYDLVSKAIDIEHERHETPEPATLGLLGLSLAALGFARRRRRT